MTLRALLIRLFGDAERDSSREQVGQASTERLVGKKSQSTASDYPHSGVSVVSKRVTAADGSSEQRLTRAARHSVREALRTKKMGNDELLEAVIETQGAGARDIFADVVLKMLQDDEIGRSAQGAYYLRGHRYGGTLTLVSRQGHIDSTQHQCDECGDRGVRYFRYAESSLGREAHVCPSCWGKVKNRSFGTVDAIEIPTAVMGGFKTSPHGQQTSP
jgi:hypothetical protein